MKTIGPIAAIVAAFLAPLGMVHAAPTETVLHSFGHGGGKNPFAGLIFDKVGNLYGTTSEGGPHGFGKVFELTPPAAGQTAWTETVLHRFKGTDGFDPRADLIFDAAGNLYGTTGEGERSHGTVFELTTPGAGQTAWHETVLYSFNDTDGAYPYAGLIFDAAGNLYGATWYGGAQGYGTVFELSPPAAGQTAWTETVLHSFTGTDGAIPISGLIFHNAGSLYGTTLKGGNLSACGGYGCGTVFELTPPAAGQTAWHETVLLRFHGTDGGLPYGRLIFDAAGHLYGTASEGGVKRGGTVFELTPPAAGQTSWNETVLYSFEQGDGKNPCAGLIFDAAGNLYGTTYWGGNPSNCRGSGCGTVFEVTP